MTASTLTCDPALTLDIPDWQFISDDEAYAINSELSLSQMHQRATVLEKAMMGDLLWNHIGAGYSRTVFHRPGTNSVIKIPRAINPGGIYIDLFHPARSLACNPLEAAYYNQGGYYGYKVLPCRLLWTTDAVPVLAMEKVDDSDSLVHDDSRPDHCWEVDGGQIGWSHLLQSWAAFDASGPLMESEKMNAVGGFECGALADYHEFVSNPLAILKV